MTKRGIIIQLQYEVRKEKEKKKKKEKKRKEKKERKKKLRSWDSWPPFFFLFLLYFPLVSKLQGKVILQEIFFLKKIILGIQIWKESTNNSSGFFTPRKESIF